MINQIIAALGGKTDIQKLQALCAELVTQNDLLRLENAKLRAANRELRRRLRDRELATLRRAEADAALIGALLYAHLPTSRAACLGYGISRRRWSWAMALLQVAHLRRYDGRWREAPMADYESALRSAVATVERDGVQQLTARLPRNGYSGRRIDHIQRGGGVTSGGHNRSHAVGAKRDQQTSTHRQQASARAGRYDLIPAAQSATRGPLT
jgi:hypothetical protein